MCRIEMGADGQSSSSLVGGVWVCMCVAIEADNVSRVTTRANTHMDTDTDNYPSKLD